MVAMIDMLRRIIDILPGGDSTFAGLHLIVIPYLLLPIGFFMSSFPFALGFRNIYSVLSVCLSSLVWLLSWASPESYIVLLLFAILIMISDVLCIFKLYRSESIVK